MDERIKNYFISKGDLPAEFSDEAEEKAKADAAERKSGLGVSQFIGGLGSAIAGRDQSSNDKYFEGVRKNIDSETTGDLDKKKKDYMTNTAFTNQQTEFATKQAKSDPSSPASVAFRKAIEANFPAVAKQYGESWQDVTADDQESLFKPLQLRETIEARKDQMRILSGDKALARADKKELQQEKAFERAQKTKELSAVQAKQLGLYNSGIKAEQQFNSAIANPDDYNPTSSGQIFDNSDWAPNWMKNDKAIAAKNARDSWIESFLRDASGAAIAPSERGAYADIYFPSPGDTSEVVKNKEAMRKQKMESAAASTGHAGMEMIGNQPAPQQDPDAVKYSQIHNLPYDKSLQIISKRKAAKIGGL